ncbi:hypothetical protein SYNPS1DRAFT_26114 [Syncephalis pseudoplumigaleata]|uniref:Uncharacterized protein n=1 Tax=Syncephalis pseudoplumigaleata TaxID=1712513 RepID=A0A4V1J0P0_9FUNG|nr:hypothetical protein SYNPS1DRAFT_26114 [Syncephalis pseudoplumigaleata]|eukprot:RKP22229.1 hypothetical protein SYNPS1DRAFT_26114 [Syncephalis pseudoplumigaleata]
MAATIPAAAIPTAAAPGIPTATAANDVTAAFNSHQNEADHIRNSDVNAFTKASNLCAEDSCIDKDHHSIQYTDDTFEADLLWSLQHNPNVFTSAKSTVMPSLVARSRLAQFTGHLETRPR